MLAILLATSGFVYWRVEHALDRQLDRDLKAYSDVVTQAVGRQTDIADQTPGEWYQVYDRAGRVVIGSPRVPLGRLVEASRLTGLGPDGSSTAPPADRDWACHW